MADNNAIASLGLDVTNFNAGIDRVIAKMDEVNKAAKKTTDEVSAFSSILQKIGGFLSIGAITGFTKSVIEMGGALNDQATALNMNVEAIQELNFAFSQSGADASDVSAALTKLNQSIEDAREGNEKTIESFEKLGISWRDINKLSPEEILLKIADGSKNATDEVAALDAIVNLLGKSGKKMAAGLKEGSDGIRELRNEASKLTKDQIATLDELGDKWDKLINKVKVYGAQFLLSFGKGQPSMDMTAEVRAAAEKAGLVAPKRDLAALFATQPIPGHEAAAEDVPEDPRERAEWMKKEEAANDRAWKKRDEAIKAEEKAKKEAADEEKEDNEFLLKQLQDQTAEAAKRNEENKRINQNLREAMEIEEVRKRQGNEAAEQKRKELELERKIKEAIRDKNLEGEALLRKQLQQSQSDFDRNRANQSPAEHRSEVRAQRQQEREDRNGDRRLKDLDDRIARGARGSENSRIEQRRRELEERNKRAQGIEDARRGNIPKDEKGYGQTDREYLKQIADALKVKE